MSTDASDAQESPALRRVRRVQDSPDSTDDDRAVDVARAPGPEDGNALGASAGQTIVWLAQSIVWLVQSAVGAVLGLHAQWQWRAARDVREVIKHTRKQPPPGASADQWLREVATDILRKTGPDGNRGALGQLRGHLFERCDIRDYNLRHAGAGRLEQFPGPFHRDFDAIRFDADGQFAGAIQHKLGAGGIAAAIKKLESRKPGRATTATFRVPTDRFQACMQAANGRTRVTASRVTSKAIGHIATGGLTGLAHHGEAATSLGRQAGRAAAARTAVISIVVAGLADLLINGNLSARQFAARRGVDAAQVGITAAATSTAIAGVTAGATFLTKKAADGTWAARAAGAVAASTAIAPTAAALVIGCAVGWAASPVRRYVTNRLRTPAEDQTEERTSPVPMPREPAVEVSPRLG